MLARSTAADPAHDGRTVLMDQLPDSDVLLREERMPGRLAAAAALERTVWLEKGYGTLDEYDTYLADCRTFTAFEDRRCVGVTRIFRAGPGQLPPFFQLPFDSEVDRARYEASCRAGTMEEVGVVAVSPGFRFQGRVSLSLWRLAYRDALSRGVERWGIIMEPPHVRALNRLYGFGFEQAGPATYYQGGDCALHVVEFADLRGRVTAVRPPLWDWLSEEPLAPVTIDLTALTDDDVDVDVSGSGSGSGSEIEIVDPGTVDPAART